MKKKSKSDKIYVKDLCLIIKHPGSWDKFEREIKKYRRLTQLIALGNLNLQNFNQGRDCFYGDQAKDVGEFIKVKEKLNGFFQKWCGEKLFEEVGDDEYRLRIFTAVGPSSKTIFFFSNDDPRYLGYFRDLTIKRCVRFEKPSGLIIPKTEQELRNCFDTLRDFQIEVVPREDAKFLAELFKKNDFKIVVEGPPMVGKSVFAYLVAREWLAKVGIVEGKLNEADLDLMKREDFLVIVDAGDLDLQFDMDLYASLRFARKLLIVRRKGEPRDPSVRKAIDAFSSIDYLYQLIKDRPIGKIRCELWVMNNILSVVNAIEKTSKIKVDDDVKKEICSICVSSDKKHTHLGFIKAIFIGLASLRDKREVGDFVTIGDFERIGALKLKEYRASEKKLEDIYSWLDDDIKKLLKAFKFLQKIFGTKIDYNELVIEEMYKAYNKEELADSTIEKAENVGILIEWSYERENILFVEKDGSASYRRIPATFIRHNQNEFISIISADTYKWPTRIRFYACRPGRSLLRILHEWLTYIRFYGVWHPWQVEIIKLYKKNGIIFEDFIKGLVDTLEKEPDIMRVVRILADVWENDKNIASRLIRNLDVDNLTTKLLKEERASYIFQLLSILHKKSSEEDFIKIIKRLDDDIHKLRSKLSSTGDIDEIVGCSMAAYSISDEFAEKISDIVKSKMDAEPCIKKIDEGKWKIVDDRGIWSMDSTPESKKVMSKLIKMVNLDKLAEKLKREKREIVIEFIDDLKKINKYVARKLLDKINKGMSYLLS